MNNKDSNLMEKIVSLTKRRGFIFPSSEIYGGMSGFYDFGPLGVELYRNIKNLWWKKFVEEREDVFGLASNVIMPAKIWEASGHVENFTDPLVECKKCHERFRSDDIKNSACPACYSQELTPEREFNTMFKTFVGSVESEAGQTFLRPETAQGMFVNFPTIVDTMRAKLPFGIAQIGRSFRNEITTGNFIFRLREFEIAELEYFVKPDKDEKAFEEWMKFMETILINDFGINKKSLRIYEHPKKSLAHYSKRTIDFEYKFPWGWGELWGLANRTDYDLKRHEEFSGKNLKYKDPNSGEEFSPYCLEPTGGIERLLLTILINSYEEIKGGRTTTTKSAKEEEVVLRLSKKLAPIKIAVLPLSRKDKLIKIANEIAKDLCKHWSIQYDETGSIGKRYRRQDEIGTPYCVTVDFDSLDDKKVTIRDRDTMKQERVDVNDLVQYLGDKLS